MGDSLGPNGLSRGCNIYLAEFKKARLGAPRNPRPAKVLPMPRPQMRGVSWPICSLAEEPVVEIGVDVVSLHEPHKMHGIEAAWKAPVGFINIAADRLCAGDRPLR
jgi:hypothetical protein